MKYGLHVLEMPLQSKSFQSKSEQTFSEQIRANQLGLGDNADLQLAKKQHTHLVVQGDQVVRL